MRLFLLACHHVDLFELSFFVLFLDAVSLMEVTLSREILGVDGVSFRAIFVIIRERRGVWQIDRGCSHLVIVFIQILLVVLIYEHVRRWTYETNASDILGADSEGLLLSEGQLVLMFDKGCRINFVPLVLRLLQIPQGSVWVHASFIVRPSWSFGIELFRALRHVVLEGFDEDIFSTTPRLDQIHFSNYRGVLIDRILLIVRFNSFT